MIDRYPLTSEQMAALRTHGHAVFPGVLSRGEVAAFRPLMRQYVAAKGTVLTGADSSTAEYHLGDAPTPIVDFVTAPRLGALAAQLLDAEAVRILHFCGMFKPAGGGPTPWHQDQAYLPLDGRGTITLWIPLTDITPEMGTLTFAQGSHRTARVLDPGSRSDFPMAANGALAAGDVSLHLGWTLHGAQANTSARERQALAIVYYADGTRIRVRAHLPVMDRIRHRYFPGLGDSDPAVGPLNPVVYRQGAR